jgi:hypothetical protein
MTSIKTTEISSVLDQFYREAQWEFPFPSEKDPTGKNPHEPGAKLDDGKSPAFRGALGYFPRAIREVATVSAFGASKYAWKGWESVPQGVERYTDALVRHLTYEGQGRVTDPDSGLLEAAHTAWNALARLELMLRDSEKNDRT